MDVFLWKDLQLMSLYFLLYREIDLNWIISLGIKVETIKFLKENIMFSNCSLMKICDLGLGKTILDRAQKIKHKRKNYNLDYIKFKKVYSSENTEETSHQLAENICRLYI